ncbi:uncharacterized protein LOC114739015 isoform X2 [Neltuma alba]|uniref:uncharacterized protein LOC114722996 isoform X2 n=1 Tax=Neltuma alba TaxID=207710 RepID=UPI0010A3BE67|nr:uncharacterized protein LOC114722996 isoform X2 [Prosopis alba]XP_028782910.1 uncharacterized protein LOC114739015 isoform X2 [Prosopis alba]
MKRRLLASFLLGFLLVTNALGDLSPRVFVGKIIISSSSLFYLQQDQTKRLSELIFKAVTAGLGRKVNIPEVTITGKEDDALKKSTANLLVQMNYQEHMTILEPKASKSINFVIPRNKFCDKNPKCFCLQYSNAKVAGGGRLKNPSRPTERQMTEEQHPEKDEAKNLIKVANEVVNLMDKDYKGMANGKPPINNHEPRN